MALFPSSSRPRTLMEQLLARKIEAAAGSGSGAASSASSSAGAAAGTSASVGVVAGSGSSALPLAGAPTAAGIVSRLRRTDSLDSTSSLGSLAFGEDVCRCDDCLLGIVDLYVISAAEAAKKKVGAASGPKAVTT
ncbi:hypothetical protein AWZ03_013834 [Drosophila navojoa]|uniref:Uncharacterized protein n=1 Tax=Drosophila navojoa TaxID=7232 RepID=A0A484ATK0_DRONA|nr:fibroin heavy chain-like [Drosophila navojoa]TDG39744.1 hypothetical protein AWZ03_013834 [Drosophila navojoa]